MSVINLKTQGLIDTHCHIHTASSKRNDLTVAKWHEAGFTNADVLLNSAKHEGVSHLICVGTDYQDSIEAIDFAARNDGCYSSVGAHPHEAKSFLSDSMIGNRPEANLEFLIQKGRKSGKLVAIGEIGLDYYYEHSPRPEQQKLLEIFLDLARTNNLPVIFHVRESFDDFWSMIDNFTGIKGVLHSFTDSTFNLEMALKKDLYIGLNGIMTFTKDHSQLEMARQVPLSNLVLETDAPYLSPKPVRGKICKPEYIKYTAEFLSSLRSEDYDDFVDKTSTNAKKLFKI